MVCRLESSCHRLGLRLRAVSTSASTRALSGRRFALSSSRRAIVWSPRRSALIPEPAGRKCASMHARTHAHCHAHAHVRTTPFLQAGGTIQVELQLRLAMTLSPAPLCRRRRRDGCHGHRRDRLCRQRQGRRCRR